MSAELHDCAGAGCTVKPDGTPWLRKPDGRVDAVVWDNNTDPGRLITRTAARGVRAKEDEPT